MDRVDETKFCGEKEEEFAYKLNFKLWVEIKT